VYTDSIQFKHQEVITVFRIKEEREKAKLTQEELAEKVGITRAYLSQLENNHKEPSIKLLTQIAKALNISIKKLICERTA
jgi:putative transcriptional regulator